MKIIAVFFKDALMFPGAPKLNAEKSVSLAKHPGLEMGIVAEGVTIKDGSRTALVPFGNIQSIVSEEEASGSKKK